MIFEKQLQIECTMCIENIGFLPSPSSSRPKGRS